MEIAHSKWNSPGFSKLRLFSLDSVQISGYKWTSEVRFWYSVGVGVEVFLRVRIQGRELKIFWWLWRDGKGTLFVK